MNFDRVLRQPAGLAQDFRNLASISEGDRMGIAIDSLWYRAMAVYPHIPGAGRRRSLAMPDGRTLHYRRNRGDIQSIREVLVDECYRVADLSEVSTFVDLGANIGLTSRWYSTQADLKCVVAVEPDPANAELVRANLRDIGVAHVLIEAAVGPESGHARFRSSGESNLGRVDQSGNLAVRMVTMDEVLTHVSGQVDLLKIDIEGGEGALLEGDLDWLSRVDRIIVEFHPEVVDYPRLVSLVVAQGFSYIRAESLWPGSMDMFVRR